MSEPIPITQYATKMDETPREFNCKECGATLGTIRRRKHDGGWITYLDWWGLKVYHGDIPCRCGNWETWTMNQGSYDALMGNYESH